MHTYFKINIDFFNIEMFITIFINNLLSRKNIVFIMFTFKCD